MSLPRTMNCWIFLRFISLLRVFLVFLMNSPMSRRASSMVPIIDLSFCSMIMVPSRMECAPRILPFSMTIISVAPPEMSRIMELLCLTELLSSFRVSVTAMYMSRFSSIPSITFTVHPVFTLIRST